MAKSRILVLTSIGNVSEIEGEHRNLQKKISIAYIHKMAIHLKSEAGRWDPFTEYGILGIPTALYIDRVLLCTFQSVIIYFN